MAKKIKREKIVRPIITEKSLDLVEGLNQYTFEVSDQVTKKEVKKRIEEKFEVTVEKVRIMNMPAKFVSFGKNRIPGIKRGFKKAIVTLKSSDNIDIFKVN